MRHIPKLSKSIVMHRIGRTSFMRAQSYVDGGSIVNLRQTGHELKAHCNEYIGTPYQVEIKFLADEIISTSCSCPMGHDGRCKHVGAVLILWVEEPERFRSIKSLTESLEQRSKSELILFLRQLVQHDPFLTTRLEVPRLNRDRFGQVSEETVRVHVKSALECIDLNEQGAFAWISAELIHIVQLGDECLGMTEWENAVTIYQAIIEELLADSSLFDKQEHHLQSIMKKCVFGLGSCIPAIDNAAQREEIFRTLFEIYRWEVQHLGIEKPYHEVTDIMLALGTRQEKEQIAGWLQRLDPSDKGLSRYTLDRLLWALGN